jgi:hypothetical protein
MTGYATTRNSTLSPVLTWQQVSWPAGCPEASALNTVPSSQEKRVSGLSTGSESLHVTCMDSI